MREREREILNLTSTARDSWNDNNLAERCDKLGFNVHEKADGEDEK